MSSDAKLMADQLLTSDLEAQTAAAEALARMGDQARPAALTLVRACESLDDVVRQWCVAALEELGPPPVTQIADLAKLANSSHVDVAYWATTLLGRAGDDASTAVATLGHVLDEHPDIAVRQRAAWALGKIGPSASPALPALRRAAEDRDPRLNRLAHQALNAIGP